MNPPYLVAGGNFRLRGTASVDSTTHPRLDAVKGARGEPRPDTRFSSRQPHSGFASPRRTTSETTENAKVSNRDEPSEGDRS